MEQPACINIYFALYENLRHFGDCTGRLLARAACIAELPIGGKTSPITIVCKHISGKIDSLVH
jgi:hypothetical protein